MTSQDLKAIYDRMCDLWQPGPPVGEWEQWKSQIKNLDPAWVAKALGLIWLEQSRRRLPTWQEFWARYARLRAAAREQAERDQERDSDPGVTLSEYVRYAQEHQDDPVHEKALGQLEEIRRESPAVHRILERAGKASDSETDSGSRDGQPFGIVADEDGEMGRRE